MRAVFIAKQCNKCYKKQQKASIYFGPTQIFEIKQL